MESIATALQFPTNTQSSIRNGVYMTGVMVEQGAEHHGDMQEGSHQEYNGMKTDDLLTV